MRKKIEVVSASLLFIFLFVGTGRADDLMDPFKKHQNPLPLKSVVIEPVRRSPVVKLPAETEPIGPPPIAKIPDQNKGLENAIIKSQANVGKELGNGGTLAARDGKPGMQVSRPEAIPVDSKSKPIISPIKGGVVSIPVIDPRDSAGIDPPSLDVEKAKKTHPTDKTTGRENAIQHSHKNDGKELGNGGALVARDGKPGMEVQRAGDVVHLKKPKLVSEEERERIQPMTDMNSKHLVGMRVRY